MKKFPVVHFELPADDQKRISDFYHRAFGWDAKQLGPEMHDYVLVQATETDERGYPTEPGRINGGFYKKKDEKQWPKQHPNLVIAIDDINEHMKIVEAAGGRILGEPMEIPGYGTYVSFLDTEGNRISMIQPLPGM